MRYETTATVDIRPTQIPEFRKLIAKYAESTYDRNSLNFYHSDVTSIHPHRVLLSCHTRGNDPDIDGEFLNEANEAAMDAVHEAQSKLGLVLTAPGAFDTVMAS